jgi:hypothetical protein
VHVVAVVEVSQGSTDRTHHMMSCTAKHGVTSDDCGPAITSMTGQVHQFLDEGGPVEDDARDLADRYVAIWNEPDAERRRNAVKHAMRHRCAFHLLQPPEEVRHVAAALGVMATFQARGHRELHPRISRYLL